MCVCAHHWVFFQCAMAFRKEDYIAQYEVTVEGVYIRDAFFCSQLQSLSVREKGRDQLCLLESE